MLLPKLERSLPCNTMHLLMIAIDKCAEALIQFREGKFGPGLGVSFNHIGTDIPWQSGPQAGIQRFMKPFDNSSQFRIMRWPRQESTSQSLHKLSNMIGNQILSIIDPDFVWNPAKGLLLC